ncbi:transcription factor E2F8 isoform X2 [Hoplias malabaricus]|uniref:transcription factor E2F8 isoform X2 n=1 Tax=Hoplias malabaricus TaxID=27720 RepID=UPI0034635DC4
MLSPRLYNAVKKRWKMSSTLLDGQTLTQKPLRSTKEPPCALEPDRAVFVEPQTPVKTLGRPSAPVETPGKSMGPLATPPRGPEPGNAEPWTPTSNLKMLISAASPEIRNREKERSADTSRTEEELSSQEPEAGEESEKLQMSRKEKSLGLLCHKFLARYPDFPNPAVNNDICLDDVAAELNVERRRIYDIMNVLESLQMVSRLAKNRYTWHGRAKLEHTLAGLRRTGEENQYRHQIQLLTQRNLEQELELDYDKENEEEVEQRELSFSSEPAGDTKAGGSRKDKSLRVMSQKFVMLFLVSSPRVVSLEIAAKILIGEDQVVDQDKSKFKTKIRRLYDIANVLSSLELIKKVHVTEDRGRKPAFKWTGPEVLPSHSLDVSTVTLTPLSSGPLESRASLENCTKNLFSSSGKRSFTRHHSLVKLAKSIQEDRRKINSAPASPTRVTSETAGGGLAHLAAICKMQLDQQSRSQVPQTDPEGGAEVHKETSPSSPRTKSDMESGPFPCSKGLQIPALPPGAVPYLSPHYPSMIPVLLPQPQVGRSYALYVHHAHTKPPPTSLAVRSMTFESPKASPVTMATGGQTRGHDPVSPALKRVNAEQGSEGSPSKVKRKETSAKSSSPTLGEILKARLKARRGALNSSRPSSRALHLDPEFSKPPEPRAVPLEHSLENYLEKEEKQPESTETTVRQAQTNSPTTTEKQLRHAEPLLSFTETQSSSEVPKASTPTYNIFHTPTAGSRPPLPQEFTPTGLQLPRVPSFSPSPSQAILNFTLKNLGLITSPSTHTHTPTHTPSAADPHHSPTVPAPHGMIFIKPVSPAGALTHTPIHTQPLAFISLQQPILTTPKGGAPVQQSFFQTPVSCMPPCTPTAPGVTYAPQRKLHVSADEH